MFEKFLDDLHNEAKEAGLDKLELGDMVKAKTGLTSYVEGTVKRDLVECNHTV